ncbi:gamma-glutamylcyclotransferase family protein [Desulfovibrio subterraneus]|uniref:AIG2 family protein n=1 Tax=Desulfovibrio subterraneus TaxID=2718620 RepID=A0A7J0BLU3_9BACT|nr:gamma-glutamylcyclotransferase family protein [Desulfovibrio subterraneus]GFM34172.1 AIG2 family protein [Desulfovibrio subterraneus]
MSSPFRLFVYGTLKQGGEYHDRFCSDAVAVIPCLVQGRIFERPEGYPTLFVPPGIILAHGTADREADAARCNDPVPPHLSPQSYLEACPPWGHVFGQLMLFRKALPHMERLDALEDFFPGKPSMYERVLVPVWSQGQLLASWTYVSPHSHRFESDCRT